MVANAGLAFACVCGAGACTAIGAAAVFNTRLVQLASKTVLAVGLGFAAGVMLWVSFYEIIGKANEKFGEAGLSDRDAGIGATALCFGGMVVVKVISMITSLVDSSSEGRSQVFFDELLDGKDGKKEPLVESSGAQEVELGDQAGASAAPPKTLAEQADKGQEKKLMVMGVNTAIAIALHNFPEGLAGFLAISAEPKVGVVFALATAIHNIPEGLSVAVPIYYSTGNRLKAFLWGAGSGLAEPLGAVICYFILASAGAVNNMVYAIMFGLVSGIMIMIVVSELLPTAFRYDRDDEVTSKSVIFGMALMAASILLFEF